MLFPFQLWSVFSTLMLLASCGILITQSIPAVRGSRPNRLWAKQNATAPPVPATEYQIKAYDKLLYADIILCLAMLTEYVARLVCCPKKINFIKEPKVILSFLSLLPSVLSGFLYYYLEISDIERDLSVLTVVVKIMFCLRLLRIICLARYDQYFPAIRVLILTVRASISSIFLVTALMAGLALIFGGCLYYIESHVDSIPYGMWWAAVTMTTLGYGDVSPVTPLGMVFGILCVVTGIMILVLPIPIVSQHYEVFNSAMIEFHKLKEQARVGAWPGEKEEEKGETWDKKAKAVQVHHFDTNSVATCT